MANTEPGTTRALNTADAMAMASRAAARAKSLLAVLEGLIPIARRIVGVVRAVAWSSVVATFVIVAGLAYINPPDTGPGFGGFAFLALILVLPTFLLLALHGALVEVLELPEWLRRSPELARTHGAELTQLVHQASGSPAPGQGRRRIGRDVFRSGRLLLHAHGDLPEYGRALRLFNVAFLLAVFGAFIAVVIEWFLAMFVVLLSVAVLVTS